MLSFPLTFPPSFPVLPLMNERKPSDGEISNIDNKKILRKSADRGKSREEM